MKKKQLRKSLKGIKSANSQCFEFINYMLDKYELFTSDEKKGMLAVGDHLLNMTNLFKEMEKGIGKNES